MVTQVISNQDGRASIYSFSADLREEISVIIKNEKKD